MALSAEERLILIRVKVKRAKKHLAELEAEADKYRDAYTQVVVAEEGSRLGGVHRFRKLPVVHFDMLAIAGDVLQNLRSSLDHVIYQLALVANPSVPDSILRKVGFPIGVTLHDYDSLRDRRIGSVLRPEAIQFIDGLRPYRGGNDQLWRPHEVNNIDKHRALISIGENILCEGDGFQGHYWLKASKPQFATVDISEKLRNTPFTGIRSVFDYERAKRDALVPALRRTSEYVESLVERFKPFLE